MHATVGDVGDNADVSDAIKLRKLRPQIEKVCIYCKQLKPASEYHSHKYITKTGRESIRLVSGCKPCDRERIKAHRIKNTDRYREQAKAWKRANKSRVNERQRLMRAGDPDRYRNSHLKSTYGIGLDEFNKMAADQNGLCACCHLPPQRLKRKAAVLHVDHCHETGKIRGLLCHQCNVIIGLAKDSPITLRSLADYLER